MPMDTTKMKTKRRRGRPSKKALKEGGHQVPGDGYYCEICRRSFPRKKSLNQHNLIHSGEKPHLCDYPGCEKAFRQSSHLKSHIYTHTGEKPYRCPVEGCSVRFAHAIRQCDHHKSEKLIRDGKVVFHTDLENLTEEQIRWIQMYKEKKFAKAIEVPNPKTACIKVCNLKRKLSTDSFDKGPFPLKRSSPVPVINYESSAYGSYTSSEPSTSPEHISVEEAASILLDLRNGLCQRK